MVLAVASAGWVFDVYEGQLFTIFKTPMLTESGRRRPGGDRVAGQSGPGGLSARGRGGGLFFGVLGDRFGRVRIMAYTILVYSVFSALTAFATSTLQVLVLRFLVAVGAGASGRSPRPWWPRRFRRTRAAASGIFHASSILGGVLASLTGIVFVGAGAWRWGFLMGLAPALLVLWIRLGIREPERWVAAQKSAEREEVDDLGYR